MKQFMSRIAAVALATGLVAAVTAPASAERMPVEGPVTEAAAQPDFSPGAFQRTAVLTIVSSNHTQYRSQVLHCVEGTHDHPRHSAACQQLEESNGRIAMIPIVDTYCTMERDPVQLHAWIMWDGKYQQFQGEFGNACQANAETGGIVFDF
ncbi:SSI family serine proteinase inhibitor [Natronoglycomyces albus]|uniref:Subtilisin inhibitor domain-containing protein n=1 Tax=Natronoglycomyces albus TaxID=2811108 RepID=A0A895XJN6_9ACTN|nr:SSI family serine proteinase inhibitor [Natronoglycomyces albus]QSB04022.1 hypothetical protein JQS30_09315 [Natronoglycomyces albus]